MTLNYKRIISTILVFVIAVVTGVSVGKIYVDNIEVPPIVSASEEQLREKPADVEAWVNDSHNKTPSQFSALQAYLIAEYNLNHSESFFKKMTGTVDASIVTQQMKGEKLKIGNKFYYIKLSPSNMAPICSKVIYDRDNQDEIKIYPNGSFSYSGDDFFGNFDDSGLKIFTMEQYKENFNTTPDVVMPYIISSTTCPQAKDAVVTQDEHGNYGFKISLTKENMNFAGLYYAYEIKFSASSQTKKHPKWVSLNMTVTMDANFNFVQIIYDEIYEIDVVSPVPVGWTQSHDVFVDKFFFPHRDPDKIPTEEEFGEVA